ncbi:MAG TPA: GerMN domain-containing protein [Ilumatobacteraceae bacterium]|nr:GerMN domain-containing protein [Ilumatobacteraceae bacterium]
MIRFGQLVMAMVGVGCGDSTTTITVTTAPFPADSTSSTSGPADTGDVTVQVFFTPTEAVQTDCTITSPVNRTVQGPDVLANTVTALLAGPTASERETGLQSWFSADTADALRSVEIVDGTAYIDFDDFRISLSAATTSCGSAIFMKQLERTIEQFPNVERTLYSFDGDVEAFYEWIQYGSPPNYSTPTPSTTS